MINNTIPVCQALEIEDPKAAAVCAVEVLNPFHAAYTGLQLPWPS